MKAVFADTSFFLASLNPNDELHEPAIALSREISGARFPAALLPALNFSHSLVQ